MTTDTSEKGLETLIMLHMTGVDGLALAPESVAAETPDAISAAKAGGSGWFAGHPKEYDRAHALDVPQLFQFLQATQPEAFKKLGIADYKDSKDINRQKFLARLSTEIGKRGVIDVLRKGVDHGPLHFTLFYGTPSPGNATAAALFAKNRFSVICLLSALHFHGLTTQLPSEVWLAVPRTAWRPQFESLRLRLVFLPDTMLGASVESHLVEGVTVRVFTAARTVADCFKFRNKIGVDVAIEALRERRRRKLATSDDLWREAKRCRVANVMRPYLEAIS